MKYFFKRWLLITTFLSGCLIVSADEHGIIITANDGSVSCVQFSESPKISFNQNDEVVFSMKSASLAFPLNKIDHYSFGNVPDGTTYIDKATQSMNIDVKVTNSNIILRNIASDSAIKVFSLSGEMISSVIAKNNEAIVNTTSFAKGVYIIDINSSFSFKFYKK